MRRILPQATEKGNDAKQEPKSRCATLVLYLAAYKELQSKTKEILRHSKQNRTYPPIFFRIYAAERGYDGLMVGGANHQTTQYPQVRTSIFDKLTA